MVTNIEDLSYDDMGDAGSVAEKRISGEEMIFVEECKDPKSVTLLIRGSTEHVVDEIERAVEDAIGVVAATVEDGKVVAGGGAAEISVAKGLKEYAETISGREQLAVSAFAEALKLYLKPLLKTQDRTALTLWWTCELPTKNPVHGAGCLQRRSHRHVPGWCN